MITQARKIVLPTSEHLTYWRSDGGTCTVDIQFEEHGPIVASSTSGAHEDALLTLAARFKTLAIELENLATPSKKVAS